MDHTVTFDPRAVRLMIGYHSHGTVLPVFAQSLALLTGQLAVWGVRHSLISVEDCLVDRGRDRVVAGFMASDCTHLLFLDCDLEFAPGDVIRLLAADKDVVGGVYQLKDSSGRFVVSIRGNSAEWDERARAIEVHGLGAGFLLIQRKVFTRMADAMPEIAYVHEQPDGQVHQMHAYFEQRIVNGRRVSEDILFCHRWRAMGGQVWACPDITLRHWGRACWDGSFGASLNLAVEAAEAAI